MNRIRNIQILFLLGAAALLSACTSVTTTVPSGRAPAFEARADQVVVIDPADVAAELHTQVEPLLAETAGRDRVIVVSYSLAPVMKPCGLCWISSNEDRTRRRR